jgi:hypothetical protein
MDGRAGTSLPTRVYGFADGKVVYTEWFTRDVIPAHIAGRQVKLGMNIEEVKKMMYDKTATNGKEIKVIDWPVREKPDLKKLPANIIFLEYGYNNDYFVIGHSDGKVVYAEYLQRTGRGTGR